MVTVPGFDRASRSMSIEEWLERVGFVSTQYLQGYLLLGMLLKNNYFTRNGTGVDSTTHSVFCKKKAPTKVGAFKAVHSHLVGRGATCPTVFRATTASILAWGRGCRTIRYSHRFRRQSWQSRGTRHRDLRQPGVERSYRQDDPGSFG